nr:hypothetical protein [Streptomyces olivaceoviridis]
MRLLFPSFTATSQASTATSSGTIPRTGGKTMPSSPSAQSSATPHGTPAAGTAASSRRAPSHR